MSNKRLSINKLKLKTKSKTLSKRKKVSRKKRVIEINNYFG
jgi:hypothetical protein